MGYIGNRPTAVPLTSADFVDDSVTLAKMAGLARGKLIYGDTSGDPAALAVGSANEVLTHDGTDLAWAAASGFDVSSITGATALGAEPADTDEFVLSDAGVLKRVDYSYIKGGANTPAFSAYLSADQSISAGVTTKVAINTEVFDTDSAYDNSTNYRFTVPAGEDGKYLFLAWLVVANSDTGAASHNAWLYKNGAGLWQANNHFAASTLKRMMAPIFYIDDCSAADYYEIFVSLSGTNQIAEGGTGSFGCTFGALKLIGA